MWRKICWNLNTIEYVYLKMCLPLFQISKHATDYKPTTSTTNYYSGLRATVAYSRAGIAIRSMGMAL